MRKKVILLVIALVLLLILAGLALAGNYFFEVATLRGPKAFLSGGDGGAQGASEEDSQSAREARSSDALESWLSSVNTQRMEITSADGLNLAATYIEAPEPQGRTAILVHGYMSRGQDMLYMAQVFVEQLGYHVLLPDLRAHGESQGEVIGFGWLDRKDILLWIDRVLQQHGKGEQLVLYGVSMGAATVMMTAGEDLPNNVKAIIADCGYTSAKAELSYQLGQLYKLPSFPLSQIASLFCKLRGGYFYGEASATRQLGKTDLPLLLIHGEEDAFVPYAMMAELYEAAAGPKQAYSVPGAGHGEAYSADRALYIQTMRDFLSRYISID